MSRRAVDALIEECRVELEIDLKPALDRSKLADRIAREIGSLGPQAEIRQLLRRLLPPQLIPLASRDMPSPPRHSSSPRSTNATGNA